MAGKRPGTICLTNGDSVDGGTLCLTLSPTPIVVGIVHATYVVGREAIAIEIARLRHNIDEALDYIDSLPDYARRSAAEQFFSSFFDHYLPKKFLHQYIYGHGHAIVLSEREMIDCNPYITVMNCHAFTETLDALRSGPTPNAMSLSVTCPAGAFTNGTLGQFSVKLNGTLAYNGPTDWAFGGQMSFADTWDFDPKDFSTGGRSLQGEIKTRFANYTLPGDPFRITSVEVPFTQNATDPTVVWAGGTPTAAPDKIAKLDLELKNLK